jgi:CheY-like chemotaxis protein
VAVILVADDEPRIVSFLTQVLEEEGYTTISAADGEEALHLVETHHPDLVLTDIQMPFLTGVELCERLKANAATTDIPVVLMSTMPGDRGPPGVGDAYVEKPIDFPALLATVAHLLDRPGPQRGPLARARLAGGAGSQGRWTPSGIKHCAGASGKRRP